MEQNFKLVAPRARLAQQYGRKIEQMLFDRSGEYLVELLAVPVVRRGDRKQTPAELQDKPQSERSHTQDECSEVIAAGTINRKANSEISKKIDRRGQAQDFKPVTLSGLPTEIILLIISHIEFVEDVVSLGLVNKRLCSIAREEMRFYLSRYFAPWANQEIACVGEQLDANDFPPGLFTDAELEAIRRTDFEAYDEQVEQWVTVTPYGRGDFTYPEISKMQRAPFLIAIAEAFRLRNELSKPMILDKAAKDSLLPVRNIRREYFPTDQAWILRNLTTKQFVRAEAIALKPEFIRGPHIAVLGFGEVVLSRICWSSVAASGIKDPTNICRGIWAGHRFDIVTLARHETTTSEDEGWTDISDEVAKEIAVIWESNLGADWREELCRKSS